MDLLWGVPCWFWTNQRGVLRGAVKATWEDGGISIGSRQTSSSENSGYRVFTLIRQVFEGSSFMAGQKGRSGPPKNTNAAKHGWRTLWRRAALREADVWVRRPVELYIKALTADKPNLTAGEQAVLEVAATSKGCSLLILEELKRSGFTYQKNGAVELTPAARELPRFLSVELSALKMLGLERQSKQIGDLALAISHDIREEAKEEVSTS